MNKIYRQRIVFGNEISTIEELKINIEHGSRFVVFKYCISLIFAVTLRRFSPAYLISDDMDIKNIKKRYNIISLIFGWWGIPWGPIDTIKSLNINNKGGIDVTDDILLNINEKGFTDREIEMLKTNSLFCHPDKWDLKAFKKVFNKHLDDYSIKKIVVGLSINVDDNTEPFFTIGVIADNNIANYIESLNKILYKEFHKHAIFEFIDLQAEDELNELLINQGVSVLDRTDEYTR